MGRQRLESYVPDRRVMWSGFNTPDRYMLHLLMRLPRDLQMRILTTEGRNNAAAYIQRIFRRNIVTIRVEGAIRRWLESLN